MILIFIRLFTLTFDSKERNLNIIDYLDRLGSWSKIISKLRFEFSFKFILIGNSFSFNQTILIYTNNDFASFFTSMEDCNSFEDIFSRLFRLIEHEEFYLFIIISDLNVFIENDFHLKFILRRVDLRNWDIIRDLPPKLINKFFDSFSFKLFIII